VEANCCTNDFKVIGTANPLMKMLASLISG